MWVITEKKEKLGRKTYRKSWVIQKKTKLKLWKIACGVMVILIIAVNYIFQWSK